MQIIIGLNIKQIVSILATLIVFLLLLFGFDRWNICKIIVLKIDDLVSGIALQAGGKKWKYILLPIFYFIGINNILSCFGFVPLNKIMIVPILLSSTITLFALIEGIKKKKFNVLWDLVPHNTPLLIKPLIFTIEIVSIIMKPLTLFFRLFLNVVISHYIVEILHGLTTELNTTQFIVYSPVITIVLTGLNIMEICISVLQSFIFINFGSLLINNLTTSGH